MDYFFTLFIFFTMLFVLISIIYYFNRTGDIFNPFVIFSLLSVLDIYIPSVIRILYPEYNVYPIWMDILEPDDLIKGTVFYFIGWLLFSIGYIFFSKDKGKNKVCYKYTLRESRAIKLLLLCVCFYFLYFFYVFKIYGGLNLYLQISLSERFNNSFELPSFFIFLDSIRVIVLLLIFILTANLYHSFKLKKSKLSFVFLIVGLLFSFTTLYRGTILNFFLGFSALTYYIIILQGVNKKKVILSSIKKILFVVFLFLFAGGIRTLYINKNIHEHNNVELSIVNEINKNLTGSSLIGVSSIIKFFDEDKNDYFYGKTIIDMFLMPIPRSIYTSKPLWYGIDDIGKKMNWPPSTQTATSPQGEYFANFGYIGILLMLILGGMYGKARSLLSRNLLYMSLYSFIVIPSVLTTFWMSTTGLINSLRFFPILFFILLFIFKKEKLN